MAKKFGKILLFTAAVGTAAAAAYYYLRKKDAAGSAPDDDDYDDFSEDLDEDTGLPHGYVPLTPAAANGEEPEGAEGFTPLKETVAQAAEETETTVEEFFDEEDPAEEEPAPSNN